MKRLTPLPLALLLLLTAFPIIAFAGDGSDGKFKLLVDDNVVVLPGPQPYLKQDDLMIPLRHVAQALGYRVDYAKTEDIVHLSSPAVRDIALKSGSGEASVDGTAVIAFGTAAESKDNYTFVPLSFFREVLGLSAVYSADLGEVSIRTPNGILSDIIELLTAGKYQQLSDEYFDDDVKSAIPVPALQAGWQQIASGAGKYSRIESIELNGTDSKSVEAAVLLAFQNAEVALQISLNDAGKVTGMRIGLVPPKADLPSGLTEEDVVVGEGTPHPLKGTLTLPEHSAGPLAAVVLVQGSGPSDRDETVGSYYKPFRDIAWGLAQQGIAVLRYDKRTYAYGSSYTPEDLAKFTVAEETVDDAIFAANLLKGDKRIDASRIYVAGHSLGGMLAPRIDADGGNFAGLIIMAGSSRPLWEVSYDQNEALLQEMDDADPAKKVNEELVAAELVKAQNLDRLSDADAMATTVFGISAYYLKEMDSRNAADLVAKLDKPILVMQGEDDFQVSANKDYPLWQEQLQQNDKATFKLYKGLNHFFIRYEGADKGTVAEYNHPGNVDAEVIRDMADWVLGQ